MMTTTKRSKPVQDGDQPSQERLKVMIEALASSYELDKSIRAEIKAVLVGLVTEANPKGLKQRRARPIEYQKWVSATIARELVSNRGANPYDADSAAAESQRWRLGLDPKETTPKEVARVAQARQVLDRSKDGYRELPNGDKHIVTHIPLDWIDDAEARLRGGRGSSTKPSPGPAISARLFDKIKTQSS